MGWRVSINRQHVRLWRGYAIAWAAFVAFGLVAGWRLGPRPDEVLFVLLAPPLAILTVYAAGCLGLAVLRSLRLIRAPDGARGRTTGLLQSAGPGCAGGAEGTQSRAQDIGRPRLR